MNRALPRAQVCSGILWADVSLTATNGDECNFVKPHFFLLFFKRYIQPGALSGRRMTRAPPRYSTLKVSVCKRLADVTFSANTAAQHCFYPLVFRRLLRPQQLCWGVTLQCAGRLRSAIVWMDSVAFLRVLFNSSFSNFFIIFFPNMITRETCCINCIEITVLNIHREEANV